ncbi:urease accessory protein UreD [Bacillus cereus]|uniref:urease accessory protein UreD n=1 Tax=Bacillus cereus TaxID=1396 RepID=UPI003F8A2B84
MPWLAQLDLDYSMAAERTRVHFHHDGPLRVLRSLYPEGDAICHNVLVHPPGGLVGGDTLDIRVRVQPQAHALVTTPGATRFYKTQGETATQRTHLQLDAGARLEWLPLEALAYNACDAHNQLTLALAPGAELIAWDITAFGLPHAGEPFVQGQFTQHMAWPGHWLEHGTLRAEDARLMDGPLGLAGQRCMGSLVLACGTPLTRVQREQLLDATRAVLDAHPQGAWCGITAPNAHMLVLRGLAPVVEPLMQLWQQVRACWRQQHWGLPGTAPRIWSM